MEQALLISEQEKTLASKKRKYGLLAKLLFFAMDIVYGRKRSLSKFKVLEVIARVPYQAWEHVAYVAMSHRHHQPGFVRRVYDFVKENREQQDNEQWHLLILEELIYKKQLKENFIFHRFLPMVYAFAYYHISWLLYVFKPKMSYQLNADFEDHAEHEYMLFVEEHPEFQDEAFESDFKADYHNYDNLADVFRQIALDERHHKEESMKRIESARFN